MTLALLRRWLPLILLMSALAAMLLAARLAGVTIGDALRWLYQTAHDTPWLLLLLFFLRPPFILPISWLVLLCGMLWGLVAGGAMAVAGMLLSAISSYGLARYAIPARAETAQSGKWARRLREQGLMSVVLMRLMLLPFDVVNFAAAGLRVDFRSYFVGTVLGNSAATLIYASVGAAIHVDAFLSEGKLPPLHEVLDARQLLLSLAVLAVSLLVARYFKRRNGAKSSGDTLP